MHDAQQTRGSWHRAGLAITMAFAALILAACGGGETPTALASDSLAKQSSDNSGASKKHDDGEADDDRGGQTSAEKCLKQNNNNAKKLLDCVTLDGVRVHQKALQDIADANNGIRTSGTPGYDASADYAENVLRDAGYIVTRQNFEFQTFIELSPTTLAQTTPTAGTISTNIMSYSGSGSVTALVGTLPVVTGCDAADFAGFTAGNIALISRGVCTFATKATNAQAAGAVGVVIYNNRAGELNGTLGGDFVLDIAVTSVEQAVGEGLAATPGLMLALKTDTFRGTATTSNILAQSQRGDADNVIMVGAHLDSVNEGPGINDNGSGSAAILEVARQMAKVQPRNAVRFALWGAEESGLLGSEHYVTTLPEADRAKIALYLNFDMIGSPNHVFFVYDGDDSDAVGSGAGPGHSNEIEAVFNDFYTSKSVAFKGTDFDGRSDYGPFIEAGIAAGGLFTGAEGIKTAEEAALWGGTAGTAYDPCYHQACDNFGNVNLFALDLNSDAVAFNTLYWAQSKTPRGTPVAAPAPGARSAAKAGAQFNMPKWRDIHEHVTE